MRTGSFQAGINRFAAEVRKKAEKNVRKTLLACLQGCISRSPVDTGSFRLNWNIQAKSPDTSTKEIEGKPGKSPKPAGMAELAPALNLSFDMGDLVYISNALPYSQWLESGGSKQAPTGVVAPTIREVENKIKEGALD